MSGREGPVRIEVVCTANICRSPYVQVALSRALDAVAPGEFVVTSSGTLALPGNPPDPGTRQVARARGLSTSGLRSTTTSGADLMVSDLVLVMEKAHRQAVVDESPGAVRRTFLLKELSRLIEELAAEQPWRRRLLGAGPTPRDRWAAIAAVAAAERERLRADGDELPDPYRKGAAAFEAMARQADAAIRTLSDLEASLR